MADFSIISDVSNEVLKLLRENICPELIQSPESIALAAPTDKNADFLFKSILLFFRSFVEIGHNVSRNKIMRRVGHRGTHFVRHAFIHARKDKNNNDFGDHGYPKNNSECLFLILEHKPFSSHQIIYIFRYIITLRHLFVNLLIKQKKSEKCNFHKCAIYFRGFLC